MSTPTKQFAHRLARVTQRKAGRWALTLERASGLTVGRYPTIGSLERNLIEIIDGLGITCVIDVGAHHGEFARTLRTDVGFEGRIVSVEPAEGAYRRLVDTMRTDSKWRGMKLALGDAAGTAELTIIGPGVKTNLSSLHAQNARAHERFGRLADEVGHETVQVQRLDAVLDQMLEGLDRPRVLLKIDTQGHDLAVVKGAGERMGELAAVLLEAPSLPIYEDVPTIDALFVEMRNRGFDPSNIFPVLRTSDGLRMMEFDCTFVNRAMVAPV